MFKEEEPPFVPAPGEEELAEKSEPDPDLIHCLCDGVEFEVVGATAAYSDDANSARWFYLGLRCARCGCLGCYDEFTPRHNDHEAFLSLL
jgi:hypothetical protein